MQIPPEAFNSNLTHFEFHLLAVMCHKSVPNGDLRASVEDLGTWTSNSSKATVKRGIKALKELGFISIEASRRANGYRGVNKYQVLGLTSELPLQVLGLTSELPLQVLGLTSELTSRSNVTNGHIAYLQLVPSSNTINSNKIKDFSATSCAGSKEIVIPMKNFDDSEGLASFGLAIPKDLVQPKIARNDPRTRGKRPEHEWTPMDVASEFSYLVGRRFPHLPGTMNVKNLSGALAKYRNQYQTSALIELEILKLFMLNEHNFKSLGNEAPHLYKKYLGYFRTHMNQARSNLGLTNLKGKEFDTTEPTATVSSKLTASDGREFFNTMSGRAVLKQHEERLKEKQHG